MGRLSTDARARADTRGDFVSTVRARKTDPTAPESDRASARQLKICHVKRGPANGEFQWGGVETAVRDLANATAERGHQVHVVAPRTYLQAAALSADVTTTVANVVPADIPRLVKLFRAERFDVIVMHTFRSIVIGSIVAALTRTPARVTSLHNSPQQAYERLGGSRTPRSRALRVIRRSCNRALLTSRRGATIAVSASMGRDLVDFEYVKPGRMAQIDNWVSPRFRPMGVAERLTARSDLGLGPTDIAVAFVGRLEPQKRPSIAVDASVHLTPRHRFLIAGDGSLGQATQHRADEVGSSARFLGHVDDAPTLLAAADVVLVPSAFEAFGRVAAEALACGTRVVVADVAGLRDAVGYAVGAGATFVAPDATAAAWGAAIASASAAPVGVRDRIDMSTAAAERHGLRASIERYIALYYQLLAIPSWLHRGR